MAQPAVELPQGAEVEWCVEEPGSSGVAVLRSLSEVRCSNCGTALQPVELVVSRRSAIEYSRFTLECGGGHRMVKVFVRSAGRG